MNFIDAWWDTRNLGLTCAEVGVNRDDDLSVCDELLQLVGDFEYITVKIPAGRIDIVSRLEQEGFSFSECLIELNHDLKEIDLSGFTARFDRVMSRELVLKGNEDEVYSEIRKGLFNTDRVYLDPQFSSQIAAERYVNWLKDEIERGSELYHVLYKNQRVGFFVYKEKKDGVAYPFLASLYHDFFTSGLGANVVVEPMKLARERGCSRIDTFISSNNPPILRIHEHLGFRVQDIFYVMTIHH